MTDKFLSTPSARRATTCCRCGAACGAYFYPRPPRGGRRSAAGLEGQAGRFLSTPSARRATPMSRSICARRSKFLSTPSARRATLYNHRHAHCCQISIHALREEGDLCKFALMKQRTDFYPRPPRGGRPYLFPRHFLYQCISIHALREEGDLLPCSIPFHINLFLSTPSARRATSGAVTIAAVAGFLSTPSARRATCTSGRSYPDSAISIHALREEGDNCSSLAAAMTGRISIHALREEGDLLDRWEEYSLETFLSTPSARRATVLRRGGVLGARISIHALREEGDQVPCVSFPLTS